MLDAHAIYCYCTYIDTVVVLCLPILISNKLNFQEGLIYTGIIISHADENGDVYIQYRTDSFNLFEIFQRRVLDSLVENLDLANIQKTDTLNTNTIYLTFYDNTYYRCQVASMEDDGKTVIGPRFHNYHSSICLIADECLFY